MSPRLLQYADVETAYDDPERIARLAGLIGRYRDDRTIVCGSGDNTGPGVLSLMTEGQQAVDFFEHIEADVETIGNHDFDHGSEVLEDIIAASPQTWVYANAVRDGDLFASEHGATASTVIETADARVGIVGLAHPETADINPNAAGVEFTDAVIPAESEIEALRDAGVDYLVALSHLGTETDLARELAVDVVLGGHDHEPLTRRVDGTLVCRPGGTAQYLLDVRLTDGQATAVHHDVDEGPLDTAMESTIRERMAETGLSETVGTVEDPIYCDMMACKRGESRLGNLVTDAYRWQTGADVAINSGGGFRRQPPLDGDVTAFDLVGITPFEATLQLVEIDGTQLRQTCRDLSLVGAPDDIPEWHFGHVSGATVVWDDETEELRRVRVDGNQVAGDETYELATSELFVAHDELFSAFGTDDVVATYGPQYEAVVNYARETGIEPALTGRIQRPALEAGAIPGRSWPHSPTDTD